MTWFAAGICALTMLNSWFVSRGRLKLVYCLGIFNGTGYVVINAFLAATDWSAAPLIIPSFWGIVTSVLGLRRLAILRRTEVEALAAPPAHSVRP